MSAKRASRFLFGFAIILLITVVGIAGGQDKMTKIKRLQVGSIWRYLQSQGRAVVLMDKKSSIWREKKLFVVNSAGSFLARLRVIDKLGSQGGKNFYQVEVLPLTAKRRDKAQGSDSTKHLRMGYPVIIRYDKEKWVHNPKRRKQPFVKPEMVRPYDKTLVLAKDRREMVLVSRGKFVMGTEHGEDNEAPQRVEYLDDYYIDRYEVSNDDFKRYLKSNGQWEDFAWQTKWSQNPQKPFGQASYYMARDYCGWAGKSLPTEAQWEKAARGTGLTKKKNEYGHILWVKKTRSFPWGDDFAPDKCNGNDSRKHTLPVAALKEGASPYGALHMCGNVMEWTRSWYKAYDKSHATDRDFGEIFKVLRGGDFRSKPWDLRATRRIPGGYPSLSRDRRGGIRCVYNVTRYSEVGP